MILLDTHILIWLTVSHDHITPPLKVALNEAAQHRELYLSPISIWEIALKHSRNRLQLDRPVRQWARQAMHRTGIQLAPISIDIATECAELPSAFHGDPADRLIVATARVEGMQLMTADKALLDLAQQGFFQAIPA